MTNNDVISKEGDVYNDTLMKSNCSRTAVKTIEGKGFLPFCLFAKAFQTETPLTFYILVYCCVDD